MMTRLTAFALAALATSAAAEELPRTITVQGQGQVAQAPDIAVLTGGVVAAAPTAADAMAQMSAQMSDVLALVRQTGVEPRDVQTSALSLYPRYAERRDGAAQEITGFEARSDLTVTLRDLTLLGGLLDQMVGQGANTLNGLSFALADPKTAQQEARRAAVADARARAEVFAEAAGVTLGPLLSLTEGGGGGGHPLMAARMMEDTMSIAEGEVSLSATVTMIYRID